MLYQQLKTTGMGSCDGSLHLVGSGAQGLGNWATPFPLHTYTHTCKPFEGLKHVVM